MQTQDQDNIDDVLPAVPSRVDDITPATPGKRNRRRWITAAIVVGVFLLGVGVGGAATSNASELDAAKAQTASVQAQLDAKTGEATLAQQTLASTQSRVSNLEDQLSAVKGLNGDLQGRIAGLKKDVAKWKGQATQKAHQGGYSVNAAATFGNGTWRVGEQIQPGTYQAPGGGGCYWERLSGFSGNLGDIIANDFASSNVTVTIASTDVGFTSQDCGTWHKIG